ncbi:MAG: endo,4-beta-xylanase [Actinomycetota bacterium]|nr:endo,4-beta-xylanase [Actinomycetota bacterium]
MHSTATGTGAIRTAHRRTRVLSVTALTVGTGLLAAALAAPSPATAVAPAATASPAATSTVSLRSAAAATGRLFGTGVMANHLGESDYVAALDAEFGMVTPENEMTFIATEPQRREFVFSNADRIVNHALSRGMKIRGYTLVWHSTLPNWVLSLTTPEQARKGMNDHITTVMAHFKGKIHSWDVVNEAFTDGPEARRRGFPFQYKIGDTYIEEAFRTARAADPSAKLCYNDYNIDGINPKSDAVYALVKDFTSRGVPIDCVGFQSHFGRSWPVPPTHRVNLERFAALGVDVQLTELDIEDPADVQARDYAKVVGTCVAIPRCTAITVWGVTDKYSWRSMNRPLLLDASYGRKPAYHAVLDALGAAPVPTPSATP